MAHITLCTTPFFPGKNDNKPVQKKRFGGPNHKKDSPSWFCIAVVLFIMNTLISAKCSLPATYLHISDGIMWLVGVWGALGRVRIPPSTVTFVWLKKTHFWSTFFDYKTWMKQLAALEYALYYYILCHCMVGCCVRPLGPLEVETDKCHWQCDGVTQWVLVFVPPFEKDLLTRLHSELALIHSRVHVECIRLSTFSLMVSLSIWKGGTKTPLRKFLISTEITRYGPSVVRFCHRSVLEWST